MKNQNKFISEDAKKLWNKLHGMSQSDLPEPEKKIEIEISKEYNISTRKKNNIEGV